MGIKQPLTAEREAESCPSNTKSPVLQAEQKKRKKKRTAEVPPSTSIDENDTRAKTQEVPPSASMDDNSTSARTVEVVESVAQSVVAAREAALPSAPRKTEVTSTATLPKAPDKAGDDDSNGKVGGKRSAASTVDVPMPATDTTQQVYFRMKMHRALPASRKQRCQTLARSARQRWNMAPPRRQKSPRPGTQAFNF